jgi:tetraacyldisaccharide 4'-kinase
MAVPWPYRLRLAPTWRQAPKFWWKPPSHQPWAQTLLRPFCRITASANKWRSYWQHPQRAGIPVLCVGNAVVGGAGKTPTALALMATLKGLGISGGVFLSRGYGGRQRQPLWVKPGLHTAHLVGDEALLLAQMAPTIVAASRYAGAQMAVRAGARFLILDDGLQSFSLHYDLRLLVIDGEVGIGNGALLPAGPLREPFLALVKRVDGVVMIGEDRTNLIAQLPANMPCFMADLLALNGGEGGAPMGGEHSLPADHAEPPSWAGKRVVAFAGIGRPEKFFTTLRQLGAVLCASQAFADHAPYHLADLVQLEALADHHHAQLITTAKDHLRLPPEWQKKIAVLPVYLAWRKPQLLSKFLTDFSEKHLHPLKGTHRILP